MLYLRASYKNTSIFITFVAARHGFRFYFDYVYIAFGPFEGLGLLVYGILPSYMELLRKYFST
jgi:hypothetical protein